MNKQEAIEEINNLKGLTILDKTINFDSETISKKEVLNIVKQLDEPEKPVVPQYVADWIEIHKRNAPFLKYLFTNNQDEELQNWLVTDENQNSMAKAWLFGYEVEKEKLYLASFRDTNQYLGWNEKLGEWFMSCSPFTSGVEQTQETWEGVGIWNNPAFEIKEVDE